MKTTFSIIKADVGGWPGHAWVHPDLKEIANIKLRDAQISGLIKDFHVTNCGDDLELIMTHTNGTDAKEIHSLSWDTFCEATEKARDLGLYGAGQDLLVDAFSGNIKGTTTRIVIPLSAKAVLQPYSRMIQFATGDMTIPPALVPTKAPLIAAPLRETNQFEMISEQGMIDAHISPMPMATKTRYSCQR